MWVLRTVKKSGGTYQDDILKDYSPSQKDISTVLKINISTCTSRVLAIVMEMSTKTRRLAGS